MRHILHAALLVMASASVASAAELFISVEAMVDPPYGWVEFCKSQPRECDGHTSMPRNVVLSAGAWKDLVRVNTWVNGTIRPLTDLKHWGVDERWSYPDDGYGDCEDYALLKRRILINAGWPRSALLMTVVRDTKDEGHAILTVRTDRGEFILDNQGENIVAWHQTGYRFVKRQSQSNPNQWVTISDQQPLVASVPR